MGATEDFAQKRGRLVLELAFFELCFTMGHGIVVFSCRRGAIFASLCFLNLEWQRKIGVLPFVFKYLRPFLARHGASESSKRSNCILTMPLPDNIHSDSIILASQSSRRHQLLAQAGFSFRVIPPDGHVEPVPSADESPQQFVQRVAKLKAENVAQKVGAAHNGIIIGCDTVVACSHPKTGRKFIIGKPADRRHAREILDMLRGREHVVLSGLCLLRSDTARKNSVRKDLDGSEVCQTAFTETKLFMEWVSDKEIESYLDTNAWEGKAGAFGYQEQHDWIRLITGSESNVVGLPLELLKTMLCPPFT